MFYSLSYVPNVVKYAIIHLEEIAEIPAIM
jgi:hypothetical protein